MRVTGKGKGSRMSMMKVQDTEKLVGEVIYPPREKLGLMLGVLVKWRGKITNVKAGERGTGGHCLYG